MKITITEDMDETFGTTWAAEVPDGVKELNVSVMADGTGVSVYADGQYIPLEEEDPEESEEEEESNEA